MQHDFSRFKKIAQRNRWCSLVTASRPFATLLTVFTLMFGIVSFSWSVSAEIAKSSNSSKYSKTALDGLSLRKIRRAGVGFEAGGAMGMGGAALEVNFTDQMSGAVGFGGAPAFQAFTGRYKYILGGESVLPYVSAGYAHWYTVGTHHDSISDGTTPGFLANRFLNENQKRTGVFALDLVYPVIGVQVIQPSGPWAGSAVALEMLYLLDISDFKAAPTAALNYMYYF